MQRILLAIRQSIPGLLSRTKRMPIRWRKSRAYSPDSPNPPVQRLQLPHSWGCALGELRGLLWEDYHDEDMNDVRDCA